MKIATVNGRKIWVSDDYVDPNAAKPVEKVEPVKTEKGETKAKKAPANKSRKAGSNK